MNRLLITAIIITAVFSSLITYTFTKKFVESNKSKTNQSLKRINKVASSPTPTEKPIPKYSITINDKPTLNNYGFTFNATIKNISAKPFITNLGFDKCNFIDGKNNKYPGSLSGDVIFKKAVLPDESQDFIFKDTSANVLGLGHTVDGLQKCSYDDKGINKCEIVNDLKIVNCVGYITTDGKQASNEWGGNPIKVEFP